jgi:hypothetical protein
LGRVSADRPINADVPSDEGGDEKGPEAPQVPPAASGRIEPPPVVPEPKASVSVPPPPPPPERPRRRRRRPIPAAIKLVAGLVLLAIAFIVLVVVAGGGGSKKGDAATVTETAAAPLASLPPAEGGGESEGGGEGGTAGGASGLAFPLVATDNTTRIGGATPAENAAAAALAVFPSTTAAQRPQAVVLVDEEDWAAAIAAAVLMAPPLRAPLLLATADGLPPASEAAFAALEPQGGDVSKGARGFAFGDAAIPDGATGIESIRGEGSAATAAAIAELRDQLFGSAPAAVVVAPLDGPEFAAPAAAYAARSGDPVLFAEKNALPKPTAEALKRHTKVPVYVLGPSSAISAKVIGEIEKLGPKVVRVSGSDPVRNAIAFARYGGGSFGWGVDDPGHGFVLARSDSPLDAAAAAPLSASGTWGPLLLTDSAGTLPPELRNYFLDVKPGYTDNPTRAFYNHVWVVGDQEAIDVKQQAEVNELAELAKIGEP